MLIQGRKLLGMIYRLISFSLLLIISTIFVGCKGHVYTEKRTLAGNISYLSKMQKAAVQDANATFQDNQGDYYAFNNYNEQVKYYEESAPKEVFLNHKEKKNKMEPPKAKFYKQVPKQAPTQGSQPMKVQMNAKGLGTNNVVGQNSQSVNEKNNSSSVAKDSLVDKPKSGLVKIVPKNQQNTNTTPSNSNSNMETGASQAMPQQSSKSSSSATNNLPMDVVEWPQVAGTGKAQATQQPSQSSKTNKWPIEAITLPNAVNKFSVEKGLADLERDAAQDIEYYKNQRSGASTHKKMSVTQPAVTTNAVPDPTQSGQNTGIANSNGLGGQNIVSMANSNSLGSQNTASVANNSGLGSQNMAGVDTESLENKPIPLPFDEK